MQPPLKAGQRQPALGAFKSNFRRWTAEEPTEPAAAKTESAATDASRAALEALARGGKGGRRAGRGDAGRGGGAPRGAHREDEGRRTRPINRRLRGELRQAVLRRGQNTGPLAPEISVGWKESPAVAKNARARQDGFPADSDFITDDKGRKVFRNIARLSKKRVAVVADVAYEVSEGIPNRLLSDIVAASIQIQVGKRFGIPTLRIPLPLKGLGWLDVTYLDDKLRVTRGNRGGPSCTSGRS